MEGFRQDLSYMNSTTAQEQLQSQQGESSQDISQVVEQALNNALSSKEQEKKEAEYQKRLAQQERNLQREQSDLEEASQSVMESLKQEMSDDKEFSVLIEDNPEFSSDLINYIAEVGQADEAAPIIREIANNDDYKRQLKNADTSVKAKRLINKVRKDVLTGGSQGKVPTYLKNNIKNFNPNNSNPRSAIDYASIALRHGI